MTQEKRDDDERDNTGPPVSEPSDEDVQPVGEPEDKKPVMQLARERRHPGALFCNPPV